MTQGQPIETRLNGFALADGEFIRRPTGGQFIRRWRGNHPSADCGRGCRSPVNELAGCHNETR
jgi:hypothetical protein